MADRRSGAILGTMASIPQLLSWVKRLTNLDPERCDDALSDLRSWGFDHLNRELLDDPDVDTIVAAVLLAEAVRDLAAQGVERTKLMKKLRDAKTSSQFWPVWAEIRSAAVLIGYPEIEVRLEMEVNRGRGRHADFRLVYPDDTSVEIEFKAVGLSEGEVGWHRRAAEHFDTLLPPIGLSNIHGWPADPIRVSQSKRDRAWKKSRQVARKLRREFPAWANIRGIAVVGRETEEAYLHRVQARIESALGQLSTEEECYVGLWWGNGAPIRATQGLLEAVKAPANVAGLVFIGQGIAVPWSEINVFISSVMVDADVDARHIYSAVDDELAGLILDRFESSSGLRPTLLRAPGTNGITLLRRDGERRIFPFNLLFDADPRRLAAPSRPPSPVQDTEMID